jgi:hypothetical protein
MATLTIGLGNLGPALGQPDPVRDPAGVKDKAIPHPLKTFLGQVVGYLIVRQMTVDAFDSAVGPLMPPGIIFGLHDMAGSTEFRGFGRGIKFRRAEGGKQSSGDTDYDHYSQIGPKSFSFGKGHGPPPMKRFEWFGSLLNKASHFFSKYVKFYKNLGLKSKIF